MASNTCWKCLTRFKPAAAPANTIRPMLVPTSNFSTSASLDAVGRKAAPSADSRSAKQKTTRVKLNVGKKKKTIQGSKPAKKASSGERKAMRKRIILSNTNAFEVDSVVDLKASNAFERELLGSMGGLSTETIDSLRAIEAFKPSQGWGFFRRPAALIREQTHELAKAIETAAPDSEPTRRILVGDRGTGKSVLLLQAQTMAFLKGWVVIHLPEAADLVSGTTAYEPLPGSQPVQYVQRQYVAELLSRIAKANAAVLKQMTLKGKYDFAKPVQSNISLDRLCYLGAQDQSMSWEIFMALFSELSAEGAPPILYTADGLAHLSRFSEYLRPNMHYIHAHDLALVGHFIDFLTGKNALPNGGMVLAADSQSNRPSSAALDYAIRESKQVSAERASEKARLDVIKRKTSEKTQSGSIIFDPKNPHQALDQRTAAALLGMQVMDVPGLSKDEARAVLEYYAKSGMLRATINETLVSEKWTLSGGGIVGELERGSVRRGLY